MSFTPGWKLTVFTGLLFPLLLSLGIWQLGRADEKQGILDAIAESRSMPAVSLTELGTSDPAWRSVTLKGEFLADRQIFIDNQTNEGRFGYEVVLPFEDNTGQVALVSLGWVAGSLDRSQLPELADPVGPQLLRGQVYVPLGDAFTLGDTTLPAGWPKRVQWLVVSQFDESFDKPIYPYVVRLAETEPLALDRHWQSVNVMPSKHTGYAVQWFTMATVLCGLYLAVGFGLIGRTRKG